MSTLPQLNINANIFNALYPVNLNENWPVRQTNIYESTKMDNNNNDDGINIFHSASEYNSFHYEGGYEVDYYKNVSIYAISLQKYKTLNKTELEFITCSGDVKNIIGYGKTAQESKDDFIQKIYNNIYNKIGGIYLLSSDFDYHEKIIKELYPSYLWVSIDKIEDIILFPSNLLPTQ